MGKKKITKQPKSAAKETKQAREQKAVESSQRKPRKSAKQQPQHQILTSAFFDRLNTFQSFYREVLELKSEANNTDINEEINTINEQVRKQLQNTSSRILANELVNLEKWIQGQQKRLQTQIESIKRCYQQNRKSLEATGAFTADEITSQLQPVQARIDERQTTHDNYGSLLTRSRQIYKQDTEQPQQQQNQVNNNNQQHMEIEMNM